MEKPKEAAKRSPTDLTKGYGSNKEDTVFPPGDCKASQFRLCSVGKKVKNELGFPRKLHTLRRATWTAQTRSLLQSSWKRAVSKKSPASMAGADSPGITATPARPLPNREHDKGACPAGFVKGARWYVKHPRAVSGTYIALLTMQSSASTPFLFCKNSPYLSVISPLFRIPDRTWHWGPPACRS